MFVNTMPRYEILTEDADGDRSTAAGGGSSPSSGSSSCSPRRSRRSRRPARRSTASMVLLDPDFVLEQVAKAPREFDVQARNPEHTHPHRRRPHGLRLGLRAAVRARGRRCAATRRWTTSRTSCRLSQAFPELDSPGGTIVRAQRHAARLAPPRHGLRAADAVRQAVHGLGDLGPRTPQDTIAMGEILFGGREAIEATPVVDLADQRQLAAALRRPHARRDARVRARRASPSSSRRSCSWARCRRSRSPRRSRSRWPRRSPASRSRSSIRPGLPGGLRLVPLEHRHAVGLAELRHARVGGRPALHRPDRAPLRAAVALAAAG